MSLLVLGLSHRTAPVGLLERASLTGDAPQRLLHAAAAAAPVGEAALVATCNRIELYADVDKFHAGVADLSVLLAEHSGVDLEELTTHLYVHYEDRAVHHLFSVACGLDSMVVGEGQILGQLRDALSLSQEQHTAGRGLNELFQQALRVGKRAHAETGIDKAGQSLVTFGLERVAEVAGPVAGLRAGRSRRTPPPGRRSGGPPPRPWPRPRRPCGPPPRPGSPGRPRGRRPGRAPWCRRPGAWPGRAARAGCGRPARLRRRRPPRR